MAIEGFFLDLDKRIARRPGKRANVRLIGSGALMLLSGQVWGTEDVDVLETLDLEPETKTHLLEFGGPGTDLHKRHGIYIEFVPGGLPLLPQSPRFLAPAQFSELEHLEVQALDVVDVVISKLARFHARDLRDIRRMADLGRVDHEQLVERFKSAIGLMELDARSGRITKYLANLNTVERDLLLTNETRLDLPDWMDG